MTFILKSLGENTEFTLIHGGWKHPDELIGKANEKASVIHDRMSGGWIGIIEKLRQLIES